MPKTSKRSGPGAPPLAANVAQLRALAHPLRLRLLELFAERPRTTKQVAELLGQPPTRLYHHVAALERAGLLALRETRKNRGTIEKWFETPARTLGGGTQKPGKGASRAAQSNAHRAAALTILEQSRQEMLQVLAHPGVEPPLLARIIMAVPPAMIPAVRDRLVAVIAELREEYDCDKLPAVEHDDVDRWAMTMTFAPVTPGAKRA